jgi:hypothetical protein
MQLELGKQLTSVFGMPPELLPIDFQSDSWHGQSRQCGR